jgi:cytochrome c oxidase subunit 2
MAAADVPAVRADRTDRQHVRRIALIWLVLSVIAMPLVYFVLGPHLPPGTDSYQAASQQEDNTVLATVAVPVLLFIWVYVAYAVKNWRIPADTPLEEIQDGPPIRGNRGFQTSWLVITSATVLSLFVFGTYELAADSGAGTGSGSSPIWTPAGFSSNVNDNKLLQVQVIGQQWRWTYRFPQYGGVETSELVLPAGEEVQLNVTSLDVLHSFWAVNLGVKADANPGVNNIAFVETRAVGPVDIRCAELCGTYHGAMAQTGQVMTHQDFDAWMLTQLALHKDLIPQLPPYADYYIPQTDGGYYDPSQDPPPPVDSGLPAAAADPNAPSTSPSSS